jgi:hypothetical protein
VKSRYAREGKLKTFAVCSVISGKMNGNKGEELVQRMILKDLID